MELMKLLRAQVLFKRHRESEIRLLENKYSNISGFYMVLSQVLWCLQDNIIVTFP